MAESICNLGTFSPFRWLCSYTRDFAQISEIKVKASPFQTSSITIGQEQGGKPKQPRPNAAQNSKAVLLGRLPGSEPYTFVLDLLTPCLLHTGFSSHQPPIAVLVVLQECSLPSEKSKQLDRYHYTKEISWKNQTTC